MDQNKSPPTCGQCALFRPTDSGFCVAPVPQWVELQSQSPHVKSEDDASNCESFQNKETT